MNIAEDIPHYHLYGEDADDGVFDLIHVETIEARSRRHNWHITPHRHRNLHQILVVVSGQGGCDIDSERMDFKGPCVILLPATVVHAFKFEDGMKGAVISFTDDVLRGMRDGDGSVRDRLNQLMERPLFELDAGPEFDRLDALVRELLEERFLSRDGFRIAMRNYLALIVIEIARLARSADRYSKVTLKRRDETVAQLRQLIEDRFRQTRLIGDYADAMNMTSDRLNEHCKRVTGVTAGHLIRQRVLAEAKWQLIFTNLAVSEIAYDLDFADPSHFSRFFKRHTGTTPQTFRTGAEARVDNNE